MPLVREHKMDEMLSPLPEGLELPDLIITRRTRSQSMSGRIGDVVQTGTVHFFCRSRGHGFVDPDCDGDPLFMHVSDINGELIPRKGDRVRFRVCPMPPKFERLQAVHIDIVDFTHETHHRWSEKETQQELDEDKMAIKEERRMSDAMAKEEEIKIFREKMNHKQKANNDLQEN